MKTSILFTIVLLLIPLAFSVEVSEEIYNGYLTHPSFTCPQGAIRCELFKTVDAMNRNVTPPLLVRVCEPSTTCDYVNDIGAQLGFRLLPGDVCHASENFKGYMINDVAFVSTSTTTTSTTTTSTIKPETYQKQCVQYFRGLCIRWERVLDTTMTSTTTNVITTTSTTIPSTSATQSTETQKTVSTTTTITQCSILGSSCSVDSDCCSTHCKETKKCSNPPFHGFCLFPRVVKTCE